MDPSLDFRFIADTVVVILKVLIATSMRQPLFAAL